MALDVIWVPLYTSAHHLLFNLVNMLSYTNEDRASLPAHSQKFTILDSLVPISSLSLISIFRATNSTIVVQQSSLIWDFYSGPRHFINFQSPIDQGDQLCFTDDPEGHMNPYFSPLKTIRDWFLFLSLWPGITMSRSRSMVIALS